MKILSMSQIERLTSFTHHFKQPPQQEAHADLRRAWKVELIAQRRGKDEVIHVCRFSERKQGECHTSYSNCGTGNKDQ